MTVEDLNLARRGYGHIKSSKNDTLLGQFRSLDPIMLDIFMM